MKYTPCLEHIPQEQRKAINEKILYLIDQGNAEQSGILRQDIYDAYTGDGGLHGLQRKDFANYHDYSEAKKEIENGQFFTPTHLCQLVMESLRLSNNDVVGDLTCGMGSFINFMPTESNFYGCELDAKAYKVAQHLYPASNVEHQDIRLYAPAIRMDYVVGNPPFNLGWWIKDGTEIISQLYYCMKAAELLKPYGILALIVPLSFLADAFSDSGMIKAVEEHFSFLGQIRLPDDSFVNMGVNGFPTKLMFWQRKSDATGYEAQRYNPDLQMSILPHFNVMATALRLHDLFLSHAKATLEKNRYHVLLELSRGKSASDGFVYQVRQLLYQIKAHPATNAYYNKCCEYIHRFQTQKQPDTMPYKEWCKIRITEAKVLVYLRKALEKQQSKPARDVIALVKKDYDFVYKGYSAKVRRQMSDDMKTPVPIYKAILHHDPKDFPGYERFVRKKQQAYQLQNRKFSEMEDDPKIAKWLSGFWLWDSENEEEILLNDLQQHDLNCMIQKPYTLLQWEQGSGKTLAGIAVGLYRMQKQNILNTWVVSTAISIRNNWDIVMPNYALPYVVVDKLSDLNRIQQGDFVLITLNKLVQYQRQIKKWLRLHGQKVQLVFDESDEMTNPFSTRTKAVLSCFRRAKMKLLDTGTVTRNNISESAPQLELLYNNSVNMICWCRTIYHYEQENKKKGTSEGLSEYVNPYYGEPIPAYSKGYSLFTASHLPEKITVFGVGKRNQDIYNADELNDILEKTVITRTFEEVTGKELRRLHQVPVFFTKSEKDVYQLAMKDFYKIRFNYFSSTGNSRKDSMFYLLQQIVLMLRISAAPNTVAEYKGDTPVKVKRVVEMVKEWGDELVAIGVRHKVVLQAYERALRAAMPGRPIFVVTGATTTLAKRRALKNTLRESKNGILLCTQQSLPSSVNFEFVNKVVIPELHYNNARMSQFYMRFVRFTSVDWKDIYFVTYGDSIESNQMQMVLAKERINQFMKGKDADLDEIYEKFGVNYDLMSLLMSREADSDGNYYISWGEQTIA